MELNLGLVFTSSLAWWILGWPMRPVWAAQALVVWEVAGGVWGGELVSWCTPSADYTGPLLLGTEGLGVCNTIPNAPSPHGVVWASESSCQWGCCNTSRGFEHTCNTALALGCGVRPAYMAN